MGTFVGIVWLALAQHGKAGLGPGASPVPALVDTARAFPKVGGSCRSFCLKHSQRGPRLPLPQFLLRVALVVFIFLMRAIGRYRECQSGMLKCIPKCQRTIEFRSSSWTAPPAPNHTNLHAWRHGAAPLAGRCRRAARRQRWTRLKTRGLDTARLVACEAQTFKTRARARYGSCCTQS